MTTYPIPFSWRAPKQRALAIDWKNRKTRTVLLAILIAALAAAALAAIVLTFTMVRVSATLPSIAQITSYRPVEATKIYTSDGILLAKLQMQNRKVVKLESISNHLIDATIAVEDSRFYQHTGVDPRGILRAVWANLTEADSTGQGGSTITQQLARNVPEFRISRKKTFHRKLREAMTARRIEQALDKNEILELYLNQVYYGSGAYGVEAAARTYFGKPASKLTLAESALLAGLPQRPHAYSPYNSLSAAEGRREVVLSRMVETGKINRSEFHQARSEKIKLAERMTNNRIYRAAHFVDWVVRELADKYGVDALYSGLQVVTTLNWRMQQAAESAVRGRLPYGATEAALVSLDPHNGHVRAMVGGRDYKKNQFNAITQGLRQPGSAFKPILYAAAFESGTVDVATRVTDEKIQLALDERKTWTVHNYGGGYTNKDRTILDAIRYSINTIAVSVGLQTGLERIIGHAKAMGITSDLPAWPSLTLGAGSVRPIELCSAYGIFAANGERYLPTGIIQVKDARGQVILQDSPRERYVQPFLAPDTLNQMNFALREAVRSGSGHAAARVPNAFGKTGTTSDYRDAWFVGYTPDLVTAVWTAAPYKTAKGTVKFKVMHGGTGGRIAAPIWARFMDVAAGLQKQINRKHGRRWEIPVLDYQVEPVELKIADADNGSDWAEDVSASPSPESATYYQYVVAAPSAQTGDLLYPPTQFSERNIPRETPTALNDPPVDILICADSGQRAGDYCLVTVTQRVAASAESRLRICRKHRAPAGEPAPAVAGFDRYGEPKGNE